MCTFSEAHRAQLNHDRFVALRLLLILVLGALLPATARAESTPLEDFVDGSFQASNVPGMVVVATRGEEIVLTRAYGIDGAGAPMTTRTQVRVASMTKTVTSVAIHQLVDDGLIQLSDPVVDHLPEFRLADARHRSITLQHLLDNRSGMRDGQFDLARLNAASSLREYVAGLHDTILASDPGGDRAYCNVNWEVLARLVEVVSNEPFAEYLDRRIFTPLGMNSSTVDITAADPPGGFQEFFGLHLARADHILFSASSGSNGLVTTGEDLARWTAWVASGAGADILAHGTREAILDRARHEGSTDGFEGSGERLGKSGMQHTELSQLRITPTLGLGAAVVVNDGNITGPTFAIADGVLDVLEGRDVEPVGSGWRLMTGAYVVTSIAGVAAGIVGVRHAQSWARGRRRGRGWATVLRLGWLLFPLAAVVSVPALARALTMGTRTVTWAQVSYLILTPVVVALILAVAGLLVLAARLRALRDPRSEHLSQAARSL